MEVILVGKKKWEPVADLEELRVLYMDNKVHALKHEGLVFNLDLRGAKIFPFCSEEMFDRDPLQGQGWVY